MAKNDSVSAYSWSNGNEKDKSERIPHPSQFDLYKYMYDQLSAQDKSRIAAHLAACDMCKNIYNRMDETTALG